MSASPKTLQAIGRKYLKGATTQNALACKTCNRRADDGYVNEAAGERCTDPCHTIGSLVSITDRPSDRPYVIVAHWRGYCQVQDAIFGTTQMVNPRTLA